MLLDLNKKLEIFNTLTAISKDKKRIFKDNTMKLWWNSFFNKLKLIDLNSLELLNNLNNIKLFLLLKIMKLNSSPTLNLFKNSENLKESTKPKLTNNPSETLILLIINTLLPLTMPETPTNPKLINPPLKVILLLLITTILPLNIPLIINLPPKSNNLLLSLNKKKEEMIIFLYLNNKKKLNNDLIFENNYIFIDMIHYYYINIC